MPIISALRRQRQEDCHRFQLEVQSTFQAVFEEWSVPALRVVIEVDGLEED